MDHLGLLTVALAFLIFGLVSRRLERSILTGPILFTAFGIVVGPALFGLIDVEVSNAAFHFFAEITLVVVLFTDAAKIDLKQLRRDHNLPLRMLLVGLPLTIVVGTLAGLALFPQLVLWEAALLAAMLAATDAALGQAVVSDDNVPVRIRMSLNVESGLNDGIALPFILIFAALAGSGHEAQSGLQWGAFIVGQVTLGPLAGILVGYAGGKLVAWANDKAWMNEAAEGIVALALAIGAFALAETIHGNGFIAAFVGGLTFGNTLGKRCEYLFAFEETEARILVLLTFTAFGCVLLPTALPAIGLIHVLYALLALTILRMLPISLSLLGARLHLPTHLFLGWFGPRGLASLLFLLLILMEAEIEHTETLFTTVVTCVLLSVVLHGLSAIPAARWYGRRVQRMGDCEEKKPVSEQPFANP